jgi:hypothetical protein
MNTNQTLLWVGVVLVVCGAASQTWTEWRFHKAYPGERLHWIYRRGRPVQRVSMRHPSPWLALVFSVLGALALMPTIGWHWAVWAFVGATLGPFVALRVWHNATLGSAH